MIITLGVRFLQLAFAAVVIGISIHMIQWQEHGSAPATTGYAAFCGGWGILAALVGAAAAFFEFIPPMVVMGIDALSSLLYLAGGIALAVAMKGITCDTDILTAAKLFVNKITNSGCYNPDPNEFSYCGIGKSDNDGAEILKSRCQYAQADYVFLFFGMVVFLVTIGLGFFAKKRGGSRGMVV